MKVDGKFDNDGNDVFFHQSSNAGGADFEDAVSVPVKYADANLLWVLQAQKSGGWAADSADREDQNLQIALLVIIFLQWMFNFWRQMLKFRAEKKNGIVVPLPSQVEESTYDAV